MLGSARDIVMGLLEEFWGLLHQRLPPPLHLIRDCFGFVKMCTCGLKSPQQQLRTGYCVKFEPGCYAVWQ